MLFIWEVMKQCIYIGCHTDGVLPAGWTSRAAPNPCLNAVKGRPYTDSNDWLRQISRGGRTFQDTLKWVSCFALAVNEETAFSRGHCPYQRRSGRQHLLVPMHHVCFSDHFREDISSWFPLRRAEIGSLFKKEPPSPQRWVAVRPKSGVLRHGRRRPHRRLEVPTRKP